MCRRQNLGSDHEEKATISVVLEIGLQEKSQEKDHSVEERDGHQEPRMVRGMEGKDELAVR